MANKIKICLISGDRNINAFMRHADVFESAKKYAVPKMFEATVTPDADLQKIVQTAKESAESCGDLVVAVFIPNTNIGWVDESVKLVSDGQNFHRLDQMLKYYGYQNEPSERSTEKT